MLKQLFVFMLVLVVLCLLEYSVFQLHNTGVIIVAMRLLNQHELSINSSQVLNRLFSDILPFNQEEGEQVFQTEPPVAETDRKSVV